MRFPFGKVAAAPLLLLDTYTGAAAAYSVRLIRGSYAGSCLRVRESGGNTEMDIGFVAGYLDTATLATFCAGVDGFVTVWYDQSGNGNNATQTTAANQPKIVSSGTVITDGGGFPALRYDGSNDRFAITTPPTAAINWTTTAVVNKSSGVVWSCGFGTSTASSGPFAPAVLAVAYVGTDSLYSTYNEGSTGIVLYICVGKTSAQNLYKNSTQLTALTSNNATGGGAFSLLGARLPDVLHTGLMQEAVLWSSDKTADVAGISANINGYFAIY